MNSTSTICVSGATKAFGFRKRSLSTPVSSNVDSWNNFRRLPSLSFDSTLFRTCQLTNITPTCRGTTLACNAFTSTSSPGKHISQTPPQPIPPLHLSRKRLPCYHRPCIYNHPCNHHNRSGMLPRCCPEGFSVTGAGDGTFEGPEGSGDSGSPPPGEGLREKLERMFEAAEVAEPSVPGWEPGQPGSAPPSTTALKFQWPNVDWSRYNIQLLFVDRTGTVRSRLAAGIFETIAEWNGWSRSMVPWSCGLHTQVEEGSGSGSSMSKRAAVFSAGSSLGLFTGSLAKPADRFGVEDLDFYDLVLVLDRGLHEEVLDHVSPEHLEYYRKKVVLLTSFSDYESEGIVLATGGLALLPKKLSGALRQGFAESKKVVDVPSPDLASATSQEELSSMVRTLILACGGLCKYLMDSFPETNSGPHS